MKLKEFFNKNSKTVKILAIVVAIVVVVLVITYSIATHAVEV